MRTSVMLCALAALGMSSPAMAALGALQFDLTHDGGSNSQITLAQGVGGVIPIEVSFTATTSGDTGVNRGVSNVGFRLETGLPLIDQTPMTLSPSLIGGRGGSTSTTLGFNGLPPDGGTPFSSAGSPDAFLDAIEPVIATQGISPDFDFRNTMGKLKLGGTAENVGHPGSHIGAGPTALATSNILVDVNTPAGTYIFMLIPKTGQVWDTTPNGALAENVPLTGDSLTLVVGAVPEPATMLLLAPVALAIRRRRRKS